MKEQLNNAMNNISEKYIEEAANATRLEHKTARLVRNIAVPVVSAAAVAGLCIGLNRMGVFGRHGVNLTDPSAASTTVSSYTLPADRMYFTTDLYFAPISKQAMQATTKQGTPKMVYADERLAVFTDGGYGVYYYDMEKKMMLTSVDVGGIYQNLKDLNPNADIGELSFGAFADGDVLFKFEYEHHISGEKGTACYKINTENCTVSHFVGWELADVNLYNGISELTGDYSQLSDNKATILGTDKSMFICNATTYFDLDPLFYLEKFELITMTGNTVTDEDINSGVVPFVDYPEDMAAPSVSLPQSFNGAPATRQYVEGVTSEVIFGAMNDTHNPEMLYADEKCAVFTDGFEGIYKYSFGGAAAECGINISKSLENLTNALSEESKGAFKLLGHSVFCSTEGEIILAVNYTLPFSAVDKGESAYFMLNEETMEFRQILTNITAPYENFYDLGNRDAQQISDKAAYIDDERFVFLRHASTDYDILTLFPLQSFELMIMTEDTLTAEPTDGGYLPFETYTIGDTGEDSAEIDDAAQLIEEIKAANEPSAVLENGYWSYQIYARKNGQGEFNLIDEVDISNAEYFGNMFFPEGEELLTVENITDGESKLPGKYLVCTRTPSDNSGKYTVKHYYINSEEQGLLIQKVEMFSMEDNGAAELIEEVNFKYIREVLTGNRMAAICDRIEEANEPTTIIRNGYYTYHIGIESPSEYGTVMGDIWVNEDNAEDTQNMFFSEEESLVTVETNDDGGYVVYSRTAEDENGDYTKKQYTVAPEEDGYLIYYIHSYDVKADGTEEQTAVYSFGYTTVDETETDILDSEASHDEIMQLIKAEDSRGEAVITDDSFIFPLDIPYNVTTQFGYDEWRDGFHNGVDLSAEGIKGTEIHAAAGGKVIASSSDGAISYYGNYVLIYHGDGNAALYAHCDSVNVQVGDTVNQGEVIATVGNTGASTGPHLHFEVIEDGAPIDPMSIKYDE